MKDVPGWRYLILSKRTVLQHHPNIYTILICYSSVSSAVRWNFIWLPDCFQNVCFFTDLLFPHFSMFHLTWDGGDHNDYRWLMMIDDWQWLVGGLEHFYFSIYWEEYSQLSNIFKRVWNHQPDDNVSSRWKTMINDETWWFHSPTSSHQLGFGLRLCDLRPLPQKFRVRWPSRGMVCDAMTETRQHWELVMADSLPMPLVTLW